MCAGMERRESTVIFEIDVSAIAERRISRPAEKGENRQNQKRLLVLRPSTLSRERHEEAQSNPQALHSPKRQTFSGIDRQGHLEN